MTKVLCCDCKHDYQDKVYGKGKRLHNETTKIKNFYRCTVCAKTRSA